MAHFVLLCTALSTVHCYPDCRPGRNMMKYKEDVSSSKDAIKSVWCIFNDATVCIKALTFSHSSLQVISVLDSHWLIFSNSDGDFFFCLFFKNVWSAPVNYRFSYYSFPPLEGSDNLNAISSPEAQHQTRMQVLLCCRRVVPTPHRDLRELPLRALVFKLSVLQIWMSGGAQGPNSEEVVNLIRKPFANLWHISSGVEKMCYWINIHSVWNALGCITRS